MDYCHRCKKYEVLHSKRFFSYCGSCYNFSNEINLLKLKFDECVICDKKIVCSTNVCYWCESDKPSCDECQKKYEFIGCSICSGHNLSIFRNKNLKSNFSNFSYNNIYRILLEERINENSLFYFFPRELILKILELL